MKTDTTRARAPTVLLEPAEELDDGSIEVFDEEPAEAIVQTSEPLLPRPLMYVLLTAPLISWAVGLLIGALYG